MNPTESATTNVTIQHLPDGGVVLRQPGVHARENVVELNKSQRLQAAGVLRLWKQGNHSNLQKTLRTVEYARSGTDVTIHLLQDGSVYATQEDSSGNVNVIFDTVDEMIAWTTNLVC